VKGEGGVVVQAGQFGGPIRRQVEGEQPQEIAELALRDSPPKQIAVFPSHESTLTCSQNRSARVDPFENSAVKARSPAPSASAGRRGPSAPRPPACSPARTE